MRKILKETAVIATSIMLCFGTSITSSMTTIVNVEAHSGRTDSSGGHHDYKNKSGLGSYHYHCGGHPAHLHKNGVCPYDTSVTSNTETRSSSSKIKTQVKSNCSKSTVKKVQKALNDLGYDCGKADGICGKKTQKALKKYQKDNGLTVDGKIGKQVKKALGIK